MDTLTLEERFWEKVDKRSTEECWEWTGCKETRGYGRLSFNGRTIGAHRVSWHLHFGAIPNGLHICHHCDNPGCVNPAHLFCGTHADNMKDMSMKGRASRIGNGPGYHVASFKLAPDAVVEIRRRYAEEVVSQKELGKLYGVSQVEIGHIVRGDVWPHIGGPRTRMGKGRRKQ